MCRVILVKKSVVEHIELAGKKEDEHMKCLQKIAETTIDVLVATRSVIAKNQELINRDPVTGKLFI